MRGPGIRSLSTSIGGGPAPTKAKPQELNWTQYRGVSSRSVTDIEGLPTEWSDTKNVRWKAELPGRGASSPIVFEDRIYLTSCSGYGMSPTDRGAVELLKHHVFCMDRETGEFLWQRDIKGSPATQKLNQELLKHGFASSTPATDGDMVFTYFGCTGLFAFDKEGKLVWQTNLGLGNDYFGTSASVVIHDDLVIVNASIESNTVYAFQKDTGKAVWKIDDVNRSWSTPFIATVRGEDGAEDSLELLISEKDYLRGFDPKTGEELWRCDGVNDYVVSTPFVSNGIAYVHGGRTKQMMAIRIGGRGDVSETHKLWEVVEGANVPSSICLTGYIYLPMDNGIMQCFDMRSGKLVHRVRLPTKKVYSSTLLAEHKLYIPMEENGVMILQANSKLEEIAHNTFESDKNSVKASLAPSGNCLFLRNDEFLYCISNTTKEPKLITRNGIESEEELIVPTVPYDFDPATGRLRGYLLYLGTDEEQLHKIYLNPYLNVLTEEQTVKSKELIASKADEFTPYREQRRELLWNHMNSEAKDIDALNEEMAKIDKAVFQLSVDVRMGIKGMFSKEQMAQHMKDSAAWQKQNAEKIAKEKAAAAKAIEEAKKK